MMYLGIEGCFDHLEHHTIYMGANYVRNVEDIESQHVLSEDPSFYLQNACVTDRTLAPPGMSTLYVLVPVTHQHPNVDWTTERDRYRGIVLGQLARVGISDLERRIRYSAIVTPADWEAMGIYRGATFSLTHRTSGRCCTCGPGIALMIWSESIWSGAVLIPVAACR